MQCKLLTAGLGISLAAWLAAAPAAHADTVVYDGAGFFVGQQSFTDSFSVATAGTLTVTLSDISWFDPVSNLNFFLTSDSGAVGADFGAGTETLQVGPGQLYAHWSGDANGNYGVGAYGLKIDFSPSTAPTVPLPRSMLLLLSGLGILLGWQRRNRGDNSSLTDGPSSDGNDGDAVSADAALTI